MPKIAPVWVTLSLFCIVPVGVRPQSYDDTELVTAIDLAVELRSAARSGDPARRPSPRLTAQDFEILIGGQTRPLVGLSPVTAAGPLPYQILIYVDPTMSDSRELASAIDLLASNAAQLSGLGSVDFVIADPEPRFVLRQTTAPDLLENLLSSQDWEQMAGDQLRALRAAFLETLAETDTEMDLEELERTFSSQEERFVQERLDLLLSFLAGQATPGRQRILLLTGLQSDRDPGNFYSSWGQDPPGPSESMGLEEPFRSTSAALAAYGWITFPIAAPPRESPLVPGLRIGKWRLAGPAGGRILGVRLSRESERDPELAEAQLEKGQALLAAGRWKDSQEAFELALHHFHGDPRTATLQARALAGLADALGEQGLEDEARSMRAMAGELDPTIAGEDPGALATLLEPTEVLDLIAEETSGRVLYEEEDLDTSLQGLGRRLRLTLQIPGVPTGEIYPVVARISDKKLIVRGPLWVRFGSPPTVSIARARLLASGGPVEPDLVLDARLEWSADTDLARLELQLPLATGGDELEPGEVSQRCRLTAAWLAEDEIQGIEQVAVDCPFRDGLLAASLELRAPSGSELAALVVEHLASERWGAEIFEVESPAN